MNSIDEIRAIVERSPLMCQAGLVPHHRVVDDNPMMTGHCINCGHFIGYVNGWWQKISKQQARFFGLYGVRRND